MLRLLSLLPLAAAGIYDCDPNSVFRPTALALNPDPPVRGKPVTMTVMFDNPGASVYDGKVVTTVSLNGIPFSPTTDPLCENTACPILTGSNDRSAVSTWPDTVSGKVTSKSQWFDMAGNSLLCVQTKVTVTEAAKPKGLRGSVWYLLEELKRDVAETGMVKYAPLRWDFSGSSSSSGGASGGGTGGGSGGSSTGSGGSGGGSTGGGSTGGGSSDDSTGGTSGGNSTSGGSTGGGSTGSGSTGGGSLPSYAPRPSKRPHPSRRPCPSYTNATAHDEL